MKWTKKVLTEKKIFWSHKTLNKSLFFINTYFISMLTKTDEKIYVKNSTSFSFGQSLMILCNYWEGKKPTKTKTNREKMHYKKYD